MNHLAKLPDGELQIMQALWKCSIPAEKEDIIAQLDRKQPIAVTTLLTVLSRLADKGYIRIEKHGRRSCYIPCITQQEYASMQSRSLFQQLCEGRISLFANALCDSGISYEDLQELAEMIHNRKRSDHDE